MDETGSLHFMSMGERLEQQVVYEISAQREFETSSRSVSVCPQAVNTFECRNYIHCCCDVSFPCLMPTHQYSHIHDLHVDENRGIANVSHAINARSPRSFALL